MISIRHWILALVLAFSLHLAAFIALPSSNTADAAKNNGEAGIEIDLGMLGDLGIAMADPVAEKQVVENEIVPEVIPPKVTEVVPEIHPEPIKLDAPDTVQHDDVHIKKQVKTIKAQKTPQKKETSNILEPVKSTQKPTSSPNKVSDKKLTTGRENTISTGGNKGVERSYFAELSAKLARYKRYPSKSRYRHEEGTITLFIIVNREGLVLESKISQSSGYKRLDDAVLSMLRKASPLPAFPPDMEQSQLSINIPVNFKLKDND